MAEGTDDILYVETAAFCVFLFGGGSVTEKAIKMSSLRFGWRLLCVTGTR